MLPPIAPAVKIVPFLVILKTVYAMAAVWSDDEPGYFALRREAQRLFRRARRKWWVVLGAALLTTGFAVLQAYRAPRNFEAKLTLRVTEMGDYDLPQTTWTNRELRGAIYEVAFTRGVLLGIYDRHLRSLDPNPDPNLALAVDSLQSDIEINIVRNRISAPRAGERRPQSAYIVLGFAAPTAERALGVLRDLTVPIKASNAERRRRAMEQSMRLAEMRLSEAERELAALKRKAIEVAGNPLLSRGEIAPDRQMALDTAQSAARQRVWRLRAERDDLKRAAVQESRTPGINFEVMSETVQAPLPLGPLLVVVAICAFLLCLPVWALLVGAFSPFIEVNEDIRRLGFPVLGHLRRSGKYSTP